MRSSSLKLAMEHGIKSPDKYRDALIHDWYLDDEHKKHLATFFLAKDLGVNIKKHIIIGTISIAHRTYEIIWVNKPETIFSNKYALLSFRYCKYLECGYVLIKKYEEPEIALKNSIPFIDYNRIAK